MGFGPKGDKVNSAPFPSLSSHPFLSLASENLSRCCEMFQKKNHELSRLHLAKRTRICRRKRLRVALDQTLQHAR